MVLACVLSHMLLFWTLSSMGRSCLDYSGFYMLPWSQNQSSLHSVHFSWVWVTSFIWQILDVLPEFIPQSFMSQSLISMCLHDLMPVKNCSLIRDLVSQLPSSPTPYLTLPEKNADLSSLTSVTNSFYIFCSPFIKKNLVSFLHGMQSSLRFCSPFSLSLGCLNWKLFKTSST